MLTVREMATIQGFPFDYQFKGALASRYRQIGDAVPPVVSYQVSALVQWMETGVRPRPEQFVLPDSVLTVADVTTTPAPRLRRRALVPDQPMAAAE